MAVVEIQPGKAPKPEKNFLQKATTKIGLGIGAVVLAGAGAGAKLGLLETKDSNSYVETPVATAPVTVATEGPQLITTPIPVETKTATVVATPEAKQEIPCLIVSQEYCNAADLIELQQDGKTFKLIGLNLPEGTPIYAPIDGQLSKATINQPSMYKGLLARIGNPPTITSSNPTFFIRGDLTFSNMINAETKKGEQIATVNSSGITNLGSYNVVLEVGINPNAKNAPSPESVLKEMFPLAFEKPPIKIITTRPQNSVPTTTNAYN